MKKHLKMYLVKREVLATDINKAINGRGKIYEITLADEKYQPVDSKSSTGFKKK